MIRILIADDHPLSPKKILNVVVIIAVVLWLLSAFGISCISVAYAHNPFSHLKSYCFYSSTFFFRWLRLCLPFS